MAGSQAMFAVFNQLSKHEPKERCDAAEALFGEASKGQNELKYALKRLVRGLSSSRAAARQGFALGLCTIMKNGSLEGIETIIDDVEAETKLTKKERGEEERDKLIGRAFGYLALLQSGSLDANLRARILDGVIALSKEKTWLKDICTKIICMTIDQTAKNDISSIEETLKVGGLLSDGAERNESDIAIAITLEHARGRYVLMTSENLKELARPLASAWRADPVRLHIVWEALCRYCAPLGLGKTFWTEVAEPALLKGGMVSPERKCAGFLVFGRLANELVACGKADEIPDYLLSGTVLSNILAHAKSKRMVLNSPARHSLSQLVVALNSKNVSDEDRVKSCRALLQYGDFDGRSGTRTLHELLSALSKDTATKFMKEVESDLSNSRAVHALAELVRAHPGEASMEQRLLELMFEKGFFPIEDDDSKQKKKSTQSDEESDDDDEDEEEEEEQKLAMQRRCRQRVFTLLKKRLKSDHEGSTFSSTLDALHKTFSKRTKKLKDWDAPDEVRDALKEVESAWSWLAKSSKTPATEKLFLNFEVLLKFLGVLLYLPMDVEEGEENEEFSRVDVVEVGSKLSQAARTLCQNALEGQEGAAKKPKRSTKKKQQEAEETSEDPVLVVVECMLALLVQPSVLLRDLIAAAARPSAPFFAKSEPAMDALMQALSVKPEEQALHDEEEEEVEMDPEESDEEEEQEGDDDKDDAEDNKRKRQKSEDSDQEDDDEEEQEEEEDEGIEDFQAYDRALGEFLRQRRESTQKARQRAQKKAARESDAFKLRVLDLVEAAFARQSAESPLLATFVVPALLQKVTSTKDTTTSIFSRISAILLRYFRNVKLENHLDNVQSLVAETAQLIERAKGRHVARLCLEALAFYIKLARRDKEELEAAKQMMKEVMPRIITKILQGHSSSTFLDADTICDVIITRFPELSWSLLRTINDISPRTPFQRLEQLKMLSRLLRSQKESISDAELKDLRAIAVEKLEKEYEHVAAGKGKAALRVKDCLSFVKQVRAFGRDDKFEEQLEALYEKIGRETSSMKVRQMVAGMSNRKAELEAILRSVPLRQGGPEAKGDDDDEADEEEGEGADKKTRNKPNKRAKRDSGAFFKETEAEEEAANADGSEDERKSDDKSKKRGKGEEKPSKKQKRSKH